MYKQNVILQTEADINSENFKNEIAKVEGAYKIQAGDRLNIEVYTNKGERVIDPNLELNSVTGAGAAGGGRFMPDKEFEVLPNGNVILPLVSEIEVQGYSIQELQEELQNQYSEYYIQPYVRIRPLNRRVVVLGAMGGQVVPLENEKMTVLEVLALAGGLNRDAKGRNIRLIRGPLDNPSVQVINLATIEGMTKANLQVLPNDIVYVEPVRRIFTESIRDIAPVVGMVTNLVTLFIVIQNLN
ncbi:polysaccharide biosynthesis/export family protein [Marivirga arenosa]|uniref:Polysaccharide biosynthesis/export family protein n=1 Tax=Marivirga arenosa TaxID=3059076 RepID=A0AA52EZZ7_9BACT|nr:MULTISPECIES: polysaccharide biosynthesis/export family protein [unclassified Marivirga]WKK86103.2 polysaccharide biosynthesis/export family protein [Marivirga sp. ABR2-2]WNB17784.1 polysaccharide biosynthesis/export family protein [Marivirga sp. BKB1-2]